MTATHDSWTPRNLMGTLCQQLMIVAFAPSKTDEYITLRAEFGLEVTLNIGKLCSGALSVHMFKICPGWATKMATGH